jgi:hypothetical protein
MADRGICGRMGLELFFSGLAAGYAFGFNWLRIGTVGLLL